MTKKILVVEDDKNIARALVIRLKAADFEVRTAFDGLSGVTTAVKEPPDLMVLDISMPAGDGFSVAERVQNLGATAGIPMIFMTASRTPGLREQAEELGAVAFFEKPFDCAELVNAIREALQEPTDPAPIG